MVTFWGPTRGSYWPGTDQWAVMRFLHRLHGTTLFCSSFYGIGVIILWFPHSPNSFADPDMSQVGDVSIDNWSSIQIITELWMEMGDIGLRECTAAFWLDWINNWWLNICSHVIIILWQSWPFESIKLNGDLLVFKLRPDPVVTLTVISFIPRSQILMHIQVFS